jgi:hypothetical protein
MVTERSVKVERFGVILKASASHYVSEFTGPFCESVENNPKLNPLNPVFIACNRSLIYFNAVATPIFGKI